MDGFEDVNVHLCSYIAVLLTFLKNIISSCHCFNFLIVCRTGSILTDAGQFPIYPRVGLRRYKNFEGRCGTDS